MFRSDCLAHAARPSLMYLWNDSEVLERWPSMETRGWDRVNLYRSWRPAPSPSPIFSKMLASSSLLACAALAVAAEVLFAIDEYRST